VEAPWLEPTKVVRSPVRATFEAKSLLPTIESSLLHKLARSAAVRRLTDISFLGAIDYSPWARTVRAYISSRFDHSVGVALLAHEASSVLQVSDRDRDVALAAALLHDVGHGPLSHSLEAMFEREFGLNHHSATAKLLTGDGPAAREIRSILVEHEVDVDDVGGLMAGNLPSHPLSQLFSGPINVDTIEGILRSANYRGELKRLPHPRSVLSAALTLIEGGDSPGNSLEVLDGFWQLKGLIYSQLVRGPIGILSDYKCQLFFEAYRTSFCPGDFDLSDRALRMKFPDLFASLAADDIATPIHEGTQPVGRRIPFVKRSFVVNRNAEIGDEAGECLRHRYVQDKRQEFLVLPIANGCWREGQEQWSSLGRSISGASTVIA
jgi:uncharacterized protein